MGLSKSYCIVENFQNWFYPFASLLRGNVKIALLKLRKHFIVIHSVGQNMREFDYVSNINLGLSKNYCIEENFEKHVLSFTSLLKSNVKIISLNTEKGHLNSIHYVCHNKGVWE